MENSKSSKDWKLLLRTKAYQVCRAQLWNRQKKQKLLLLLQESIALKASCTVVLGLDTRTRTMEPTIAGLTLNPLCHKLIFTFLCFTSWSLLISSFSLSSFLPFFCFYIANHCFSLCLSSPSFFLFSFMSSCSSFLRCFSSSSFKRFRLVSTCTQPDWWLWLRRMRRKVQAQESCLCLLWLLFQYVWFCIIQRLLCAFWRLSHRLYCYRYYVLTFHQLPFT